LLAGFVATRFALLWRFPPFVDEALYASWAWQVFEDHDRLFVSLANGKEPLLPWLGALLMWVGFEPLTAVRLVSVVSGLVTLVCTALVARELGGRGAALVAGGLCVVLPFFVVHDIIGIYDPLATATAAAALLFVLRLARAPSTLDTVGLGVALGAGLLTKQTAYIALALLPLGLVLLDFGDDKWVLRAVGWVARVTIAAGIAVAMYSVVTLSEHYDDLARVRELLYPTHSVSTALVSPGYWLERNWPAFREPLAAYLTVPIILLVAVGTGLALRQRLRPALVVLAWGLAPIAAAVLLTEVPYPRYLLPAIPPLLALAAFGAVSAARELRRRVSGGPALVAAALLTALVVGPALVFDVRVLANPGTATYPGVDDEQYVTGWASGGPWPLVARDLRRVHAGEPATVLMAEPVSDALRLLLRGEPALGVVREVDGTTRYGVTNGVALREPPGAVAWRQLARYERPRGGTPVVLYERGVAVSGRFSRTPDELRRNLGLADREFDAFLDRHPDVRAWYLEWYDARQK
jgi:4-amino-4-deoxy-L-arabinose transferase-like glycosyltransferase